MNRHSDYSAWRFLVDSTYFDSIPCRACGDMSLTVIIIPEFRRPSFALQAHEGLSKQNLDFQFCFRVGTETTIHQTLYTFLYKVERV